MRFIRIFLALIAAVLFGTFALVFLSFLAGDTLASGAFHFMNALADAPDPIEVMLVTFKAFGKFITLLLLGPILLTALIGELLKIRAGLWYITGTAILSGIIPWLMRAQLSEPTAGEFRVAAYLAIVGGIIGFVYWVLAGKKS
ncbi:hypothetical protein [Hohaiivirga grylli]